MSKKAQKEDIEKALKGIIEAVPIEFEEIRLRIPKVAMDYMRKVHGDPVKWLENEVIGWVEADIEALNPKRLADLFHLTPVFNTLLDKDC